MSGIQATQIAPQQPHLKVDFNPVQRGEFNGRPVQLGNATSPLQRHAPRMTFGEKLNSLASKIRNAISFNNSTNSFSFRMGLRQTSKQATKMATEIIDQRAAGQFNRESLRQVAQELVRATEKCTSRGSHINDVIQSRFQVVLKNMDAPQMEAFKATISELRQNAPEQDNPLNGILTLWNMSIQQVEEDFAATIKAGLHDELLEGIGNPSAEAWKNIYTKTNQLLHSQGHTITPESVSASIKYALTKQLMERVEQDMESNDISHHEALEVQLPLYSRFIQELSPLQLQGFTRSDHPILNNRQDMEGDLLIMAQIPMRAQEKTDQIRLLIGKMTQALSTEHLLDPPRNLAEKFFQSFTELKNAVKDLRSFETQLDLQESTDFQEDLNQFFDHLKENQEALEDIFSGFNLRNLSKLKELSQQYPEVQELFQHGVELGYQAQKEILENSFSTAYSKVLDNISNPLNLLRSIGEHIEQLKETPERWTKLKELMQAPIEKDMEQLISKSLGKLDIEKKKELFHLLNSPELIHFTSNLATLASKIDDGITSPLHPQGLKQEVLENLEYLVKTREELLKSLNVDPDFVPELIDIPASNLDNLTESQKNALYDHYGIEIQNHESFDVTKSHAHRALELHLLRPLSAKEQIVKNIYTSNSDSSASVNPFSQGQVPTLQVGETFWVDLPRASYSIRLDQDRSVNLLDRNKFGNPDFSLSEQLAAQAKASTFLNQFIKSPDLTRFLSLYIHQGLLSPIQGLLVSSDSPIKIPDLGGGYMEGAASTHYEIQKLESGDLQIDVTHQITHATSFIYQDENGIMQHTDVDPGSSYQNYSFGITISQDQNITIHQTPTFDFHLQR